MQLIKPNTTIDFVGKKKMAVIFSITLILIGLISLAIKGGPEYGIDFAGGTLVQVKFDAEASAGGIKDALADMDLGTTTVQSFGDQSGEFLIKVENTSAELKGLSAGIKSALEKGFGEGKIDVRRTEMVGPQVGKDLRNKGLMALGWAMLAILAYITLRFEFRFAVGAIVALVHDVLITLGVFSLFGKEIDLPIIAAFLAIIGYSLNDTIIVYDRIRENLAKGTKDSFAATVNRSVNETLSRTILTSGTTLIVVLSLFVLGGGVIHNFAFAMLVGVLIGTYSSIWVASPVLLFWEERKASASTAG